jgi:hypothetical protein
MMTEVRCERVSKGLRSEERAVAIRDAVSGLRSVVRVETEYLTLRDGVYYLPVGVVQMEQQLGLALVELTSPPDAGDARLWVKIEDFLPSTSVPA